MLNVCDFIQVFVCTTNHHLISAVSKILRLKENDILAEINFGFRDIPLSRVIKETSFETCNILTFKLWPLLESPL